MMGEGEMCKPNTKQGQFFYAAACAVMVVPVSWVLVARSIYADLYTILQRNSFFSFIDRIQRSRHQWMKSR